MKASPYAADYFGDVSGTEVDFIIGHMKCAVEAVPEEEGLMALPERMKFFHSPYLQYFAAACSAVNVTSFSVGFSPE